MIRPPLNVLACLLASACATSPETYSGPPERQDFVAAALNADTPERPVEIVETAIPLPLPGQLKPLPTKTEEPSLKPYQAIEAANPHPCR